MSPEVQSLHGVSSLMPRQWATIDIEESANPCVTNAAIAIVRCDGRFHYQPEASRNYTSCAHDALDTIQFAPTLRSRGLNRGELLAGTRRRAVRRDIRADEPESGIPATSPISMRPPAQTNA
ncbi:MAG: hypothetical protein OXN86_06985 [Chloroflexota bacterium]|nr:hypothetical protein [Rhodospirillales bacterium]MDE0380510.1 hypothetical protein [Rhodospirillales bacterium]MDE2892227.1 hypothetical protein [Chloroflexota bacterium]